MSTVTGLKESWKSWTSREEHRDGFDKSWNSWRSREEHREWLAEFKNRDLLSNVGKGCVQNTNNTTASALDNDWSLQKIESTIDSGAACCVFPRDMCNDVPTNSVPTAGEE